jgi:hypothetical protein
VVVIHIQSNKICGAHLLPNLATCMTTTAKVSNKICGAHLSPNLATCADLIRHSRCGSHTYSLLLDTLAVVVIHIHMYDNHSESF